MEHPVSEAVTGLDLVQLQLTAAAGLRLPLTQEQVVLRGAAVEARVYAENPARGFLPSGGRVLRWRPPQGAVSFVTPPAAPALATPAVSDNFYVGPSAGLHSASVSSGGDDSLRATLPLLGASAAAASAATVPAAAALPVPLSHMRVDSGVVEGDLVGIHYDPMIAKVIVVGPDRPTALARLRDALRSTRLAGLPNNVDFLAALAAHPATADVGQLDTGFLSRHGDGLLLEAAGGGAAALRPETAALAVVARSVRARVHPGSSYHYRRASFCPYGK